MGKSFVTKRTILGLLMLYKPTLTDISRQLGKSPSTIKQHLGELQTMGMIRHVNEAHLGKGKYYECAPVGVRAYNAVAVKGSEGEIRSR